MVFGVYYACLLMIAGAFCENDVGRVIIVILAAVSLFYAVHKKEKLEKEIRVLKIELKRLSRTVGDIPCARGIDGGPSRTLVPTSRRSTAVERLFPGRRVQSDE